MPLAVKKGVLPFLDRKMNMFIGAKYKMNKMSLREKARLNVCIAKDLAENFGGKKADYLKKLNQKLRAQNVVRPSAYDVAYYSKAA